MDIDLNALGGRQPLRLRRGRASHAEGTAGAKPGDTRVSSLSENCQAGGRQKASGRGIAAATGVCVTGLLGRAAEAQASIP